MAALIYRRDSRWIAARHGRVRGAFGHSLRAAVHALGAGRGGICVVVHAGRPCDLVACGARRQRSALARGQEVRIGVRAVYLCDLVSGGAGREQGVAGVDVDGYRGECDRADDCEQV